MTQIKFANNFDIFKEDFQKDTGLELTKENMTSYIQYVNARTIDHLLQLLVIYKSELFPNFKSSTTINK